MHAAGAALALALVAPMAGAADRSALLAAIGLPPGFTISVWAEVPGARSLAVTDDGAVVFVGSRTGEVHSVRDTDGDGRADEVRLRADGLKVPNGVAIAGALLFLGMQDRIAVWPGPAGGDTTAPLAPLVTVHDGFDRGRLHGWRYIAFGPDGRLYVSLGAPCNICALRPDTGKIVRMRPDGSEVELVADGVRNSVGFDWHPVTGELWFTDNGADRMGDDIPPDELNRAARPGGHYGYPYFGGRVPLAGFEDETPPVPVIAPEVEFAAHVASLGIRFYRGGMFPAEYRNDAFVAQHGSWNRSVPIGYRIVRVRFDAAGNPLGTEVFADGWLRGRKVLGRPVDIAELPDGSLLVSDDAAGVIYRIVHAP
jgi:glucose/arabinose dehydrogenase